MSLIGIYSRGSLLGQFALKEEIYIELKEGKNIFEINMGEEKV